MISAPHSTSKTRATSSTPTRSRSSRDSRTVRRPAAGGKSASSKGVLPVVAGPQIGWGAVRPRPRPAAMNCVDRRRWAYRVTIGGRGVRRPIGQPELSEAGGGAAPADHSPRTTARGCGGRASCVIIGGLPVLGERETTGTDVAWCGRRDPILAKGASLSVRTRSDGERADRRAPLLGPKHGRIDAEVHACGESLVDELRRARVPVQDRDHSSVAEALDDVAVGAARVDRHDLSAPGRLGSSRSKTRSCARVESRPCFRSQANFTDVLGRSS